MKKVASELPTQEPWFKLIDDEPLLETDSIDEDEKTSANDHETFKFEISSDFGKNKFVSPKSVQETIKDPILTEVLTPQSFVKISKIGEGSFG